MLHHDHIQDVLAARQHNAKHEAVGRAETVASQAIASSVDQLWNGLWLDLRHLSAFDLFATVRRRLVGLMPQLLSATYLGLQRHAYWSRDVATGIYTRTLPTAYLAGAIAKPRNRPVVERESPPSDDPGLVQFDFLLPGARPTPGFLRLLQGDLDGDEARQLINELLFPAPKPAEVHRILTQPMGPDQRSWVDRIKTLGHGFTPDQVAMRVAQGVGAGRSFAEMAREIQPMVDGVRYKAMRIVRTEALRVAETMNRKTDQDLGDLHAGYQIRATLDQHTRAHHAARNGLVWLKASGKDMQTTLKMEIPTLPSAPNCRCFLVTVLAPPKLGTNSADNALRDLARAPMPDPQTVRTWFQQAPVSIRKQAVTVKRYNLVQDRIGKPPAWEHFIDPKSGELLDWERLRGESKTTTRARAESVRRMIAERKAKLAEVARFGFVR